jgi:hypothetical protein
VLDSPEGVCPGQARLEYPATSVLLSNCLTGGVLFAGDALALALVLGAPVWADRAVAETTEPDTRRASARTIDNWSSARRSIRSHRA